MTGLSQQSVGYPNPVYFIGNFATDPTNTSPGQWWYNTTTMQIKENIDGYIQILASFASSFSTITYITSNTTIGGQGITVNYVDLVITNNATLTIAAGSTVNVAGNMTIMSGASVVLQDATLSVYNTLWNAGTLQSASFYDSIEAVQLQNTGVIELDGTLYLPNAGYNHILAGTISGSGTLNIQGTAITLIGNELSLSVPTVNGTGTYHVQENGICNINGNVALSLPNITGEGTLSINEGNSQYTLTIEGNVTFSISGVSGPGILSIGSGYTLTVKANSIFGVLVVSGAGTLTIESGYTLTAGNNLFSVATVNGGGTLTIANGTSLAFSGKYLLPSNLVIPDGTALSLNNNYTIPTNITVPTGSGTLDIGPYTLTIDDNITLTTPIAGSVSGTGTVSIGAGYTLTVGGNVTYQVGNISGGGALTILSGYTLTIHENTTLGISTVNIAGTLSNAGYNITIPSGTYVWNVTGSVTGTSSAATLTVNGTLYWLQSNLLPQGASSTFPSFPLTLAGTGIMIAGYNYHSSANNIISLSPAYMGAGNTDGSGNASGIGSQNYQLSSIEGTAVGLYCLGTYSNGSYYQNALIYIGTANTSYSVYSYYFWSNYYYAPGGITIYAANLPGSAGTLILYGTLWV